MNDIEADLEKAFFEGEPQENGLQHATGIINPPASTAIPSAVATDVTSLAVGLMTEAQLDRYEAFRRSSLKKPVQKLVQALTGTSIKSQDKSLIALSSIAKTFIGQLIESAVEIATERGEAGKPLEPTHIIAAYERLKQEEGVSVNRKRLRL